MNLIKKIGFFIAEPRQIDYYKNILQNLRNDLKLIIINDFEYSQNSEEYKIIKQFCINNNYEFTSSKDMLKCNQKVLIIIGTGNKSYHNLKISKLKIVLSFLKFFYAKSLGIIIEKTKLNILFLKLFKKNFTLGGKAAKLLLTEEIPPEVILGQKKLLFPRGMDIYFNHPGPMRTKHFDYFFSISKFDDELIKKNSKKKSYIIGYPRYDTLHLSNLDSDLSIKLDKKKKNILWITSDLIEAESKNKNIFLWFKYVSELTKNYNVIFRPHPNTLEFVKNLINKIGKTNLVIDTIAERDLKKLYEISFLVLADYGGPIFSALYCKKNVLLLNVKNNSNKNFKFDLKIRDYLYNIDIDDMSENKLNNLINDKKIFNEIRRKSISSREKIFLNNNIKLDFNKIVNNIFANENKN